MKKRFFRIQTVRVLVAIVLIISICLLPENAYALDSIGTGEMIVAPTAEEAAAAVSAVSYSISPNYLLPFIFDGTNPSVWKTIDTSECVMDRLYVYNENTNTVTELTTCAVAVFTTTRDHMFYVTSDQKVFQTDYTGASHTFLYEASLGAITNLDYYNGNLTFIEGGHTVRILNVAAQSAMTVFADPELVSIFFFHNDKFIWRNGGDQAFYYNISTRETVALSSEYEVNCVIAPYITPVTEEGQAGIASVSVSSINDIVFPLPEYPADDDPGFRQYPTPKIYFRNGDQSTPGCDHPSNSALSSIFDCKYYAGSRQCDGFAKYAHDRFYHLSTNRTSPSFQSADMSTTEKVFNSDEETVKNFIAGLTPGAFIRFGKTNTDGVCVEQHSVVVSEIGNEGVYFYECNQDWKCGVFYTYYTYSYLAGHYHCAKYYVNHSFTDKAQLVSETRHKETCSNCAAYILPEHTGNKYYSHFSDPDVHEVIFSCCTGYILEEHEYVGIYPECVKCAYP